MKTDLGILELPKESKDLSNSKARGRAVSFTIVSKYVGREKKT